MVVGCAKRFGFHVSVVGACGHVGWVSFRRYKMAHVRSSATLTALCSAAMLIWQVSCQGQKSETRNARRTGARNGLTKLSGGNIIGAFTFPPPICAISAST